ALRRGAPLSASYELRELPAHVLGPRASLAGADRGVERLRVGIGALAGVGGRQEAEPQAAPSSATTTAASSAATSTSTPAAPPTAAAPAPPAAATTSAASATSPSTAPSPSTTTRGAQPHAGDQPQQARVRVLGQPARHERERLELCDVL